jgi:hypothetical protein
MFFNEVVVSNSLSNFSYDYVLKMVTGILHKTIGISIACLITFFCMQLQAKEKGEVTFEASIAEQPTDDSLKISAVESGWVPATSLYLELGGKFIPSVNVDFRKRENCAISLGLSYWWDTEEHQQSLFLPSINGYYLTGKRHRLELGGGAGPFIGTYIGLASVMLFGNVGYRVQKKKGFLFRIGFTPFLSIPVAEDVDWTVLPWAGISLGYCF